MANRGRDEEARSKNPLPQPSGASKSEPEFLRTVAILGKKMKVKGEIRSKEDLVIDGEVEGTVEAVGHRLTIGRTGILQANSVTAREVIVLGKLNGSVHASEKVYVRKDAQLVGDVETAGIVIEDGAYFKGGIDIKSTLPQAEGNPQ
jgi:cytoskeletal protein CcmA (bactofilin family)